MVLGSGITVVSRIRNLPHLHEFCCVDWERNNIYRSCNKGEEVLREIDLSRDGAQRQGWEIGEKGSIPGRTSFCKGPEAKGTLTHLREDQFGLVKNIDVVIREISNLPVDCTELRWKTQKCVPGTAGSTGPV